MRAGASPTNLFVVILNLMADGSTSVGVEEAVNAMKATMTKVVICMMSMIFLREVKRIVLLYRVDVAKS